MTESSHQMDQRPASGGHDGGVAVFLGWQDTAWGDHVPLYNVIVKDHPLFGSTVTDRTLREHHLSVPLTPPSGR